MEEWVKVCGHCNASLENLGLSPAHLARAMYCSKPCAMKARRPPLLETLLNNSVRDQDSGCWNWDGYRDRKGYGRMTETGGEVLSHRISWAFHNKRPVPEGMHVLHKCDNPRCINPEHLMIGTNLDNHYDKMAKGRQRGATGELNCKAKLTEADILAILKDTRSHAAIGREYGVTYTTIASIRSGRTWKHVPRKVAA